MPQRQPPHWHLAPLSQLMPLNKRLRPLNPNCDSQTGAGTDSLPIRPNPALHPHPPADV